MPLGQCRDLEFSMMRDDSMQRRRDYHRAPVDVDLLLCLAINVRHAVCLAVVVNQNVPREGVGAQFEIFRCFCLWQ